MENFLKKYSYYDVFSSLYSLGLYPKNVAAATRINFAYASAIKLLAESGFAEQDSIFSYKDYENFVVNLVKELPEFPMLDDYLPDEDWGEVSYFYEKEVFKILYSGPLSNNYDFYELFEILHCGIDEIYSTVLQKTPKEDFINFLRIQSRLIDLITYVKNEEDPSLGKIFTPDSSFFESGLVSYKQTSQLLSDQQFSDYEIDISRTATVDLKTDDFLNRCFTGTLIEGFFVVHEEKCIPVNPRIWFSVFLEKWNKIFISNSEIIKNADVKFKYFNRWELELAHFVKQRFDDKDRFILASPVNEKGLPEFSISFPFVLTNDKEIAIFHLAEEVYSDESLTKSLDKVAKNVERVRELTSDEVKFALHVSRDGVQMKGSEYTIYHYVILPELNTVPFGGKATYPETLNAKDVRVIFLDQLLGVLDESNSTIDFFEFEEFRNSETNPVPGYASPLDLLGAYKSTHGVFQEGATIYDSVIIDPSWGSNYRYDSLKDFWGVYPKKYYFDHPRSWEVNKISGNSDRLCLVSRHFRNLRYFSNVTGSEFSFTSPFEKTDYHTGQISDALIQSLEDSINLYKDELVKFGFIKSGMYEYQIIFFPDDLLSGTDFDHIKHLKPNGSLWKIDSGFFEADAVGVRIVFDKKLVIERLTDAKDRSLQIELCQDVFRHICRTFRASGEYEDLHKILDIDKNKPNRVKIDRIDKPASFPEFIKEIKPKESDYKRALNEVATLAKKYGVKTGLHKSEEAVFTLNTLKLTVVELFEREMKNLNYHEALKVVVSGTDAITHTHTMKMLQLRRSKNQEIEFSRESVATESEREFLLAHKNRRYLVEKLYNLKPTGTESLNSDKEAYLLALADQIHSIQYNSDIVKYGLFNVELNLDRNYIPEINYIENVEDMGRTFREERFRSEFAGDVKTNLLDSKKESVHIDLIDKAFKTDLGWELTQLLAVLELLRKWGYLVEGYDEAPYYEIKRQSLLNEAEKVIKSDRDTISKIIDFLTLDSSKLLTVKGGNRPTEDLPIWEHIKREHRYIIQPLLEINDEVLWGPYSAYKASSIWQTVLQEQQLPFALDCENINKTLESIKSEKEEYFVTIIRDLVKKYTSKVETEKYLHKFKSVKTNDIGDMDVCAYLTLPKGTFFLNLECKHLYQPKSLKDANRLWKDRMEPALKKVELRHNFIKENVQAITRELNFDNNPPDNIQVISAYISSDLFIWSLYPRRYTEIELMNPYMLEQYIKKRLLLH